jgi:hypothetical protein
MSIILYTLSGSNELKMKGELYDIIHRIKKYYRYGHYHDLSELLEGFNDNMLMKLPIINSKSDKLIFSYESVKNDRSLYVISKFAQIAGGTPFRLLNLNLIDLNQL